MKTAVDSSVLLDVLGADPRFGEASREALRAAYDAGALVACEVVWAEVRAHFPADADFAQALGLLGIRFDPITPSRPPRRGDSGAKADRRGARSGGESSPTSSSAPTPPCRRTPSSPGTGASTGATSVSYASSIRARPEPGADHAGPASGREGLRRHGERRTRRQQPPIGGDEGRPVAGEVVNGACQRNPS